MADHSADNSSHGMEEHNKTFAGFVTGSMALSIICGYVLVALVAFRFEIGRASCRERVCT